ncbi:hypothetical protein BC826DRAFT_1058617, partial [Russula brevipes]
MAQTRARFQLRCSTLLHTSTPSASPRCCSEPANHSADTNLTQTPLPSPRQLHPIQFVRNQGICL